MPITASRFSDAAGNLVANAKASFAPINEQGQPISFRVGGDAEGQVISSPIEVDITTPGYLAVTLPDVNLTEPQNVIFALTITDAETGDVLLGPAGYWLQPSTDVDPPSAAKPLGGAGYGWCAVDGNGNGSGNLDLFTPNYKNIPVVANGTGGNTTGVGAPGQQGPPGQPGASATIGIQSTVTLPAGSQATVVNNGTASAAELAFGIPQGQPGIQGVPGEQGEPGAAATIGIAGTTTLDAGSQATVSNQGTSSAAQLLFGIPKGDQGDPGVKGDPGTQGIPGVAATVTFRNVTTGVPGQPGSFTNVGTDTAAVIDVVLPVVDWGIGEVVTLPAGSQATASFAPGSSALEKVLNLGLPTGSGSGGTTTPPSGGGSTGTLTLTDSNGTTYYVFANGAQIAETKLQNQANAASPVASVLLIDYDDSGNATGSYTLVTSVNAQVVYTATSTGTGAIASFTIPDPINGGTRTVVSKHNVGVYA
jgi:hypothetical protein